MSTDSVNSVFPLMTEDLEERLKPRLFINRNHTSRCESFHWWYLREWESGPYRVNPQEIWKNGFRSRRSRSGREICRNKKPWAKTLRAEIGNHEDIGAFLKLTNSYLLIGDREESAIFCKDIEFDELNVPVVKTTIGGCRIIGRMCAGNKRGLILPETIYEAELQEIKKNLPDSVEIKVVNDKLSALGNLIACNDRVAIVHPELDKETVEIIKDTLQVDVFRYTIADKPTIGSYCVLTNEGGLICGDIDYNVVEDLSSLIGLRLTPGTVNRGNSAVAAGLVANDRIAYTGMKTTAYEIVAIDQAFSFLPSTCW